MAGRPAGRLFGQTCFSPGDAQKHLRHRLLSADEYRDGTLRQPQRPSDHHRRRTGRKVQYALKAASSWAARSSSGCGTSFAFSRRAGTRNITPGKVEDNGGVYLVPAFTGLGAPYWDMYARGTLVGLTRGTRRGAYHPAPPRNPSPIRSTIWSGPWRRTPPALNQLRADAGPAGRFLMQFQADILERTVRRPAIRETTALGAAYLAGLAVGLWRDLDELRQLWICDTSFRPAMDPGRRASLLSGWHKAVGRSRDWAR